MNPKMMELKRKLTGMIPNGLQVEIRKQYDPKFPELYQVLVVGGGFCIDAYEVYSPHSGGWYWDKLR